MADDQDLNMGDASSDDIAVDTEPVKESGGEEGAEDAEDNDDSDDDDDSDDVEA